MNELYLNDSHIQKPTMIKIDVEGGEFAVIKGGFKLLEQESPIIIMEFIEPKRNNQPHKKALNKLLQLGYRSYIIYEDGSIVQEIDIENYLLASNLESDNIVFKK